MSLDIGRVSSVKFSGPGCRGHRESYVLAKWGLTLFVEREMSPQDVVWSRILDAYRDRKEI